MKKTISFFGHRNLWNVDIRERVKTVLKSYFCYEICCLIGTHGEFDRLALSVCRWLRKSYSHIKITAVFSTLKTLLKDADLYDDCFF
ncbi:MAG: hypothetical protein E7350_00870 [Clostridiales bacterium]|nr:hypothetical protein [Clostridiales bacterium]